MAARLSTKIVITVVLIVAGFLALFSFGLRGSLVYYLTVSEYLAPGRADDLGENYRINGNVLAGSIIKSPGTLGARFVMTDGTKQLPVVYARETPDTFVDGAEVVVEGSMGADGTFAAKTLLAKCPSKYEAQNRAGGGRAGAGSPPPTVSAPRTTGAPPQ